MTVTHHLGIDQGQGGAQAMEDAVALAAVLPFDTPRSDIADRLKLYEECRYERAHKMQHFTHLAGRHPKDLKASSEKLDGKLRRTVKHIYTNTCIRIGVCRLQL